MRKYAHRGGNLVVRQAIPFAYDHDDDDDDDDGNYDELMN